MKKYIIEPLKTSLYIKTLKEKFNIEYTDIDKFEDIVSKDPQKYSIEKLYKKDDLPKDKIHKYILETLYQNSFAPTNCTIWIETKANNIQVIKLKDDINIYIIGDEEFKEIEHIINIVKWISKYSKSSNKKLNLFIYLTPFKKTIKYKGQQLTRNEINSGVCYKYNYWVQLFRSEEILKVLIHELIHYYELDINDTDWVDDILPIKLPCNQFLLNEAITEAMAIILHTYYYSEIMKKDFKTLLHEEIQYSKNMFDNILYHHNIKNIKELFSICQYTNVISYYIIKYILIEDIENALICLFDKTKIQKYIIEKLIILFKNESYFNYDIKEINYELSAKMSKLYLI
jgi:hypothetical protein